MITPSWKIIILFSSSSEISMIEYQPCVIASISVIIIWSIIAFVCHICLRKRIICVRNYKSKTGKTVYDVIVLGRSYETTYEIPVKKKKFCKYTLLILPFQTKITLQVLVCQCKLVKYLIDSRIDMPESNDVPNNSVIDDLGYTSFPIFSEAEGRNRAVSFKTYSTCCVICLDDFQVKEDILLLNCRHGFHRSCIVKSLFGKPSCPCCNSNESIRIINLSKETPLTFPSLGSSYGSIGTTNSR